MAKFLSSLTPNVRAEVAATLAAEKQLEARRRAEVEQNAPLKPARKPKVVELAAPATASGDGGDAQVGVNNVLCSPCLGLYLAPI